MLTETSNKVELRINRVRIKSARPVYICFPQSNLFYMYKFKAVFYTNVCDIFAVRKFEINKYELILRMNK